jgi:hypothetical protein
MNLEDAKDHEFNPLFPPPIHSTVDDFHFRNAAVGIFYQRTVPVKPGEPTVPPEEHCDMPTSSWVQLPTSLRWQRVD